MLCYADRQESYHILEVFAYMRLFFPLTKGCRLSILLAVLFSVGEAVLELMLPQAMSDIVDFGIATGDRAYILMMGVKMLVLAVLALLCGVGGAVFAARAATGFSRKTGR